MKNIKLLFSLLLSVSFFLIFSSCGSSFYDALDQFYAEMSVNMISKDDINTSCPDNMSEPDSSTRTEIAEKGSESEKTTEISSSPETTVEDNITTAVVSTTPETSNDPEVLTVYNCEELAAVCLSQNKEAQKLFVEKFKGRIIEVNLVVIDASYSGTDTSTFAPVDYLLAPIDPSYKIGVSRFFLKEMMMFDFKWDKETRPSYLTKGSYIRVKGTVLSESNVNYIILKPICSWGTVSFPGEILSTEGSLSQTETSPDVTTVVSTTEEITTIMPEETTEETTTALLTEEVTTAEKTPETSSVVDAVKEYQNWIGTQFNSLDGSHKTLSEMIRAYVKLTGGSSYKHIKTEYQAITDTATLNAYKSELKKAGFDPNQVSLYDLVVMTSVSYKNEYGVKQSQSAAAIAHYSSDSLTWLNIGLEWSIVH